MNYLETLVYKNLEEIEKAEREGKEKRKAGILARRERQREIRQEKHDKTIKKISFIVDAFLLAFMTVCSFIGFIDLLRVMFGG